jgi:hypothetical protein
MTVSFEEMPATEIPKLGTHSVVWRLLGSDVMKSSVYTFAMAKVVYLKVSGTQEPIKTSADSIEKRDVTSLGAYLTLVLKKATKKLVSSRLTSWRAGGLKTPSVRGRF